MELTQEQKAIVEAEGSIVAVGGPGTGKTTVLMERAAHLIKNGADPDSVYMVSFNLRSYLLMQDMLKEQIGDVAKNVVCGTFRDFAWQEVTESDPNALKIADFETYRRAIRAAMRDVGFAAGFYEAEHIIRVFKSKAEKPSSEAPHYDLFKAYRTYLDEESLIDRYDIIRQHIIGLRREIYKHCGAKHFLIDDVQNMTRVEFIWLKEHMKKGAKITAIGNDDQLVDGYNGALIAEAFDELEETDGVEDKFLSKNFKTPKRLGKSALAIVRKMPDSIAKDLTFETEAGGKIEFQQYMSPKEELKGLIKKISHLKQEKKGRIGIIVYNDAQAHYVERALQKAQIRHACFAESLWVTPGSLLIMDLLHLILNQANDDQLRNVLLGYGLSKSLVDTLLSKGLMARDWLVNDWAPPSDIDVPASALKGYGAIHRRLKGYYQLMIDKKLRPRDAFKASALDLLEQMSSEDKEEALLAMDGLLGLKGKLVQLLPALRKRYQPNLKASLVVAPVEEVRSMTFDEVIIPFAAQQVWPWRQFRVVTTQPDVDRRTFYQALTRAKQGLTVTYTGEPSIFVQELKEAYGEDAAAKAVS